MKVHSHWTELKILQLLHLCCFVYAFRGLQLRGSNGWSSKPEQSGAVLRRQAPARRLGSAAVSYPSVVWREAPATNSSDAFLHSEMTSPPTKYRLRTLLSVCR